MNQHEESVKIALQNAKLAYKSGNIQYARYWAQKAVSLDPDIEDTWLWLASVSSPRASIEYISNALKINPSSRSARKAMHWAIQRMRTAESVQVHRRIVDPSIPSSEFVVKKPGLNFTLLPWVAAFLLLSALFLWAFGAPLSTFMNVSAFSGQSHLLEADTNLIKATRTPTTTYTPSPTYTSSPTLTPTDSPTPLPTETLQPTSTSEPPSPEDNNENPQIPYLPDIGYEDRWIDVDLSNQRTYAYEGDQVIRSFVVSTGTWQYPTVTGQYRIYIKYESAPMSGPGYYLPGVPFIMYFYKGYGLHGTYWHNNFGTPMSHGCVNLTIDDAEWLYYWSSIGTLVNVHY